MNGRDIPGFYFDVQKRKYFRIQPNHELPAGSSYSRENVIKARKTEEKHQKAKNAETLRKLQRIQHPKLTQSALAWTTRIDREIGLRSLRGATLKDDRARAFAQGLSYYTEADVHDVATHTSDIFCFVRDPATEGYVLAASRGHDHIVTLVSPNGDANVPAIYVTPGEASSISMSPSRVVGFTTHSSDSASSGLTLMHLVDPSILGPGSPPDYNIAVIMQATPYETMWECEAQSFEVESNSNSGECIFACGGSSSVSIYASGQGSWTCTMKKSTPSDVLAVTWMTPTVLLGGLRNGSFMLHDTRADGFAWPIQHHASTLGLKRVDDARAVALAVPDSLSMFDLRYCKANLPGSRAPTTLPVVRYLEYENRSGRYDGFDVSLDLGLVAVAEPHERPVRLFSLESGSQATWLPQELDQIQSPFGNAIGFVRDNNARDGIVVSRRASLLEYWW